MLAKTPPPKNPAVYVTESDFDILDALVDAAAPELLGASLLSGELDRAVIVRDRSTRSPFVKLNSRVEYQDLATGQVRQLQIGLPRDASIDDNRISVLTPVGAALIGMTPGHTFQWMDPSGRTRTLKVVKVWDDPST